MASLYCIRHPYLALMWDSAFWTSGTPSYHERLRCNVLGNLVRQSHGLRHHAIYDWEGICKPFIHLERLQKSHGLL